MLRKLLFFRSLTVFIRMGHIRRLQCFAWVQTEGLFFGFDLNQAEPKLICKKMVKAMKKYALVNRVNILTKTCSFQKTSNDTYLYLI